MNDLDDEKDVQMRILVTGGAGFIGSHVADAFLEAGHEVIILDNLSTGDRRNVNPSAHFIEADICSSSLKQAFAEIRPDIVNHHAAQVSVPVSVRDPLLDAKINVTGFLNVLHNCVAAGVGKVIFISSGGAVYGEAEEYPSSENCPLRPLSPYAIHKKVAEDYLRFFRHEYGMDYTILRYANVYGPRQVSHGEAGVVSIFIEQLLANRQPRLYSYEGEPQGMIRDYVYVKDVVAANLKALDCGGNEAFNIGTGRETYTRDLYDEIARQLGTDIQPEQGLARPGDLHRSLLNIEKAERLLGWKPRYTMSQGLAETIGYFKVNREIQP